MTLLARICPTLFGEIHAGLIAEGHADLLNQLDKLEIDRWTYDSEAEAMMLYALETRPLNVVEDRIIGSRYEVSIDVDAPTGMVNVDIDNFHRITGIEVLSRSDVREEMESSGIPCKRLA